MGRGAWTVPAGEYEEVNRKDHWDKVYASKAAEDLTWFQAEPVVSLDLIHQTGISVQDGILDVGAGASLLPLHLLKEGFEDVSVLEVSQNALKVAKHQLGQRAGSVSWLEADLIGFEPSRRWVLWHDRAVFHFLTRPEDRDEYCRALRAALTPDGHVIIATFALGGPSKCSGLDCERYSPESLAAVLGAGFQFEGSIEEAHETPKGGTQNFVYSWFQRVSS
ncbi:MAG: class I SAM-dependent methyltransferase [Gemmatimonadetes bacterium]|nr:class I SAM-dependent methyltransferase [Gemmatimonadota bacterium]